MALRGLKRPGVSRGAPHHAERDGDLDGTDRNVCATCGYNGRPLVCHEGPMKEAPPMNMPQRKHADAVSPSIEDVTFREGEGSPSHQPPGASPRFDDANAGTPTTES